MPSPSDKTLKGYSEKYNVPVGVLKKVMKRGQGAYYSSGSRPNTTPEQWARARLASVIMGGKARSVDKSIWEEYKK